MIKYIFTALLLTISLASYADSLVQQAENDEVKFIPSDDPDMANAMTHAKSTLDDFLQIKENPNDEQVNFSIKIGIADGETEEFFWVSQFDENSNDKFTGILDNQPAIVRNVEMGQEIDFTKNDIVDWTYIDNGNMKGNFTACAILKSEPVSVQDEFKQAYGLECNI